MLRHKRKIAFLASLPPPCPPPLPASLSFSKVHFLGHCIAFITVFEDIGPGKE